MLFGADNPQNGVTLIETIRNRLASSISDKVYYGWPMVGVAALCLFCSGPGQSHTFSVFIQPITESLGVTKASIATAYAVATLLAAFLLPRAGVLLDRYGPRMTLIAIGSSLGLACMFFGAAANFLWLAVGFGLLRFLGQGSTMMSAANLVSQWFQAKRGFAMSLMGFGFAASMAIHPLLGELLIDQFGWRVAWILLGLLTWVLLLPAVVLLVHDKPESIGLKIDGGAVDHDTEDEAPEIFGLTLQQAQSERAFYLLCLVWFVVGGLITVMHFFQVTVLTGKGLDASLGARLFTVSALTAVITMPFIGKLYDTLKTRFVIAIQFCLIAMALVAITLVQGVVSGMVYAAIFGLCNAFMLTMFGYIWPRYFGRAHLGSIQGKGQMVGVVGASLAPVPVGYAIDKFGSASATLWALAFIALATAVVTVLFLRTPEGVEYPPGLE